MTQYIIAAHAFGANAAPVASLRSSGSHNQRNLHDRVCAALGKYPGTSQRGTLRNIMQVMTADKNAGGTGYVNGDTITLAGGTSTTAAVLTVTNAIAGVIQAGGVSVTTPGWYTAVPSTTAATQASTSGVGTGATFSTTNFTHKMMQLTDAEYAAWVAGGVDVSDAIYNSSTAPGTSAATSEIAALANDLLRKFVVMHVGSSLVNDQIGANTYKEKTQARFRNCFLGVSGQDGLTVQYFAPTSAVATTTAQPREYAQTDKWEHEMSMLKFNFGADSGRLFNTPTFAYTAGIGWGNNFEQLKHLVLGPNQKLIIEIDAMTNDITYGDTNGNPGLGSVPAGTAGYTYAGSPNYITDHLIPFIALCKAAYPNCIIAFNVCPARNASNSVNAKFDEIARYVAANKASLFVDHGYDRRQIPQFDCRNWAAVTANATYYQSSDGIHQMDAAEVLERPYKEQYYRKMAGFVPSAPYASAFF